MLENVFKGLFDSELVATIPVDQFLLCILCSLIAGAIIAFSYMYRTKYTKSFIITLATLPAVVCVVIMMVNGNIGTGVAIAGAFSLVRFRSVPGSAKEITTLFLSMAAGLIASMGYLAYSILFTIILSIITLIYNHFNYGLDKKIATQKSFRITIPEDLDYTNIFDDLFKEYTSSCELVQVKSTNLGSMFRLTYHLTLRDANKEKEFIDNIRQRNGNLEITVSKQELNNTEL